MIVRQRRGLVWRIIARIWAVVTSVSDKIGILASVFGGLIILLIGFMMPGILAGSILSVLIGYIIGAAMILIGLMLFVRGIV